MPEHGATQGVRHRAARQRREIRFRLAGAVAMFFGLAVVALLFVSILGSGLSAFKRSYIEVRISELDRFVGPGGSRETALTPMLVERLSPDGGASERREMRRLFSIEAFERLESLGDDSREIVWLPTSASVDSFLKGTIDADTALRRRALSSQQLSWLERLQEQGAIEQRFNGAFFRNADSREPEIAGIRGAALGSLYMLLLTLALALPAGLAAAIYLEEFAPARRWTRVIEININNLAAVPSIIFGLLGLALFIDLFGLPRSAPLVGGLVLSLVTLPVIIIASRAAIRAVPKATREAAAALGASRVQVLFHHVIPQALPGILTGTIIGMSRALGETAPLIMVGMVAFIADVPEGMTDPATALPVQVYLWADNPEPAFAEKTAAAILVLLLFLFTMNALAIYLRQRLESRALE